MSLITWFEFLMPLEADPIASAGSFIDWIFMGSQHLARARACYPLVETLLIHKIPHVSCFLPSRIIGG